MPDHATCPVCSDRVELTPQRRQLRAHDHGGRRCPGSGKKPPVTRLGRYWSRLTLITKVLNVVVFTIVAGALGILSFFRFQPGSQTVTIGNSPQQLVSSDSANTPADNDSGRPSISSTGRYVAFTSDASNLSPLATNGLYNIYRKDTVTGQVYLASRPATGNAANGPSQFPEICGDGRYTAFASEATNLTSSGSVTGSFYQVYVNDAVTQQTTLVSVNDAGAPADGDSRAPYFNRDCSEIVFESRADNLTPGDTNKSSDVFVRNLRTGKTVLASVSSDGAPLNGDSTHADMSADGDIVAFTTWADNLPGAIPGHPGVYLRDLLTGKTVPVSAAFKKLGPGVQGFSWPSFSPDGRYLIFRSITDALDPSYRGKYVLVWDVKKNSSLFSDNGFPSGWDDACTTGVNNGTDFSPVMSDPTAQHSYRVLFTVANNGVCNLELRDLDGNAIPVKSTINYQQVAEPTINSSGDYLAWDVVSQPQLVYSCQVDECSA